MGSQGCAKMDLCVARFSRPQRLERAPYYCIGTQTLMNGNHTRVPILLSFGALLFLAGCTTKAVQTAPLFAARVVVAKAERKGWGAR